MDSIEIKHPEVLKFKEDQKIISQAVRNYLEDFRTNFSEEFKSTKSFRDSFSNIKVFNKESVVGLTNLGNFTFTKRQTKSAIEGLNKIANNYPVPQVMSGKVQKGMYLDIRNTINDDDFYEKLNSFLDQVGKLDSPMPLNLDLSNIGKLDLQVIHDSNSQDEKDFVLDKAINKIWTLDITSNPALSIKDVMAKQMVEDAYTEEEITKDTIIVEGTSGNTGAGLAVVSASKGNKLVLIIPDKMSQEKINRLTLLGAHTVVTPTSVAADDPKSYYTVRDYSTKYLSGWTPSQYDNLSNRKSHEEITGPSIWEQTNGEVTAVVSTAGTCGTVSGIGRYLKSKNPDIKIIAVDTIGSILYLLKAGYKIEEVEKYAAGYKIQGFGEDIHPKNLDLSVIDKFIRIGDATGFAMARLLPAIGFPYGQSSGAAYAAILEAVELDYLTKDDRVLVIFPDSGVPYREDVYSDSWLMEQGFSNVI